LHETFFLPADAAGGSAVSVADAAFRGDPDGVVEAANLAVRNFGREGLEVSLFACEPMVRNPTIMDIDERGRVWVTKGSITGSTFQKWGILQPAGEPHRDSGRHQSRGVADKETVFYQTEHQCRLGICCPREQGHCFEFRQMSLCSRHRRRRPRLTNASCCSPASAARITITASTPCVRPGRQLYFNMGNEGKQLCYPLNPRSSFTWPD